MEREIKLRGAYFHKKKLVTNLTYKFDITQKIVYINNDIIKHLR